jgi:hypothetical protein
MMTTLVLMSRMPKKLICEPLPPRPPPNDEPPLGPKAAPATSCLVTQMASEKTVPMMGGG